MKSNTISLDLKVRLTKTYVWSILMYGCESWTLDKETIRSIEAAEMWFLRRILKISWAERASNEEVLRRAGVKKEAVHIVTKRQLSFVGHIYRKDDLERLALTLQDVTGEARQGTAKSYVLTQPKPGGDTGDQVKERIPKIGRRQRGMEAHDRRCLQQTWHLGRKKECSTYIPALLKNE
ncbi:RNA-directed DNA polymerase from mobile element jockey [Elysia marginata]|uniref:RNA-directed DNA polymerase from mobile element jockey n=1 Tax=Elysia marginata TaxID=1093978 RepID=A0AAV4F000_9GAST|nr:RNA-directed DNA polymerase from mobile element jockey [Elysia marginata]